MRRGSAFIFVAISACSSSATSVDPLSQSDSGTDSTVDPADTGTDAGPDAADPTDSSISDAGSDAYDAGSDARPQYAVICHAGPSTYVGCDGVTANVYLIQWDYLLDGSVRGYCMNTDPVNTAANCPPGAACSGYVSNHAGPPDFTGTCE